MPAAVQAISEAAGPPRRNNAVVAIQDMNTTSNESILKQPMFNWKSQDKCNKLLHF